LPAFGNITPVDDNSLKRLVAKKIDAIGFKTLVTPLFVAELVLKELHPFAIYSSHHK
jgi:hypothetical protein